MGRSVLILLRLSMIAGAFALLFFCVRAASAKQASDPVRPPQAQSYGFVPVQDSAPETQPYGIKPIPGYTPPPATEPPQQLRGSFENAPLLPERQPQNAYGYVPLRQTAPQQPQLRTNTTTDDNNAAVYENVSNDPRSYDQDHAESARLNAGYRLGPGDKIRVTVFGESDLSGEYQVDGSGMVRLPLIGTMRATGYTAPGLEQGIASALADGYLKYPRVNVEIATYRPFYIIGAVNRPGQYPYVDNMNALNAVALAGGFTDQAVQSTLYVRHEGNSEERAVETRNLTHIVPGDVIRVKTSLFWDAMNLFSPIAGPAAIAAAAFRY